MVPDRYPHSGGLNIVQDCRGFYIETRYFLVACPQQLRDIQNHILEGSDIVFFGPYLQWRHAMQDVPTTKEHVAWIRVLRP
jgi:hypothetical protein